MNLDQFVAALTPESLKEINEKFNQLHGKIPTYSFSQITFKLLKTLVDIKPKINANKFNDWFNHRIIINQSDVLFLQNLLIENTFYLDNYPEEDLKIKFISPILSRIHFTDFDKEICDFYDRNLYYQTEKFILNGRADFMVAKGYFYPEEPYFFIQEFKPSIEANNPQPQLLAELIAAVELNQLRSLRGAFIIGAVWNFVILEKLDTNRYQYFVSNNYNGANLEDLQKIYKNLLFVKQEIFEMQRKN